MQSTDIPSYFPIPFGNSAGAGYIRTIPEASQIGITDGAASLTDGFPPLCFQPVSSGGVPPFGQDFNGLLNQLSAGMRWLQAGGMPVFSSTYATAIGGYPKGAVLARSSGDGFWISTADNNSANPDTGGANWRLLGATVADTTGQTVTLYNAYYDTTASAWKYRANGYASRILMASDGSLQYQSAGSGTAGGTITWATLFTISSSGAVNGALPSIRKYKTIDQNIVSDGTSYLDSELKNFSLTANKIYSIKGTIIASQQTVPDGFQVGLQFTNLMQSLRLSFFDGLAAVGGYTESNNATVHIALSGTGRNIIDVSGTFQSNATTGGTVGLYWGGSSGSITIAAQSWIEIAQLN